MRSNYDGLQNLGDEIKDFSDTKRKLILEILTNGDDKILKLINLQQVAFLALIDTYGGAPGMKWDDLVIKFEWTFMIKDMIENTSYAHTDPMHQALVKAAEKLKFNFNEEMVSDWRV